MIKHLIIEKLAEMPTKKSDHENGYYIQNAHWGTCFHRRATKRIDFSIYYNREPQFLHTYTRIPEAAWGDTYSVYVNYEAGEAVKINCPGGMVIGFDAPQPSRCGQYMNRSFLVYAPDAPPTVSTCEAPENLEGFYLNGDYITVASYFRGLQFFNFDLNGNRVIRAGLPATATVGDFFLK